ncbi:MAG: hypothetical protein AAGA68_07510 [Pseudomonadota bacterium]
MHKTIERNPSTFAALGQRAAAGAIGVVQVPLAGGDELNRAIAERLLRRRQKSHRKAHPDAATPYVPARPAHAGEG